MDEQQKPLEAGDLITPEAVAPDVIQTQALGDSQVDLWSPDINLEKEPDPFAIAEQSQPKEKLIELAQGSSEHLEQSEAVVEPPIVLSQSVTTAKSDTITASFVSAVSQQTHQNTSRLAPTPPYISPVHFQLPTRRWTDTTVFMDIPFIDLLSDTLSKAFASHSTSQKPTRPMMVLEQALEYPDPYVPLIKAKSWRAVAQLARNDLIACHPTHVDEIMRLWHLRWTALLKLRVYDIIQAEMDKLKITEYQEMQYENYKDIFPKQHGLMISFDVLMMMCRIPSFKGNHHESIHKAFKLLYPQKPGDFKPNKEQHRTLLLFIVHLLAKLPDFPMATKLLKEVLKSNGNDVELWSIMGRLQLQQGDVSSAIQAFIKVETILGICDQTTEFIDLPPTFSRPDLVLSQRGFVLFAQDKYVDALQYFTELLTLLPDNPSVMNNVAVCHLYSGNVGQAASFLESFMVSHPQAGAHYPEILFNLSSMYDLTDSSLSKKRALLKIILAGCGDDFDPACLKL